MSCLIHSLQSKNNIFNPSISKKNRVTRFSTIDIKIRLIKLPLRNRFPLHHSSPAQKGKKRKHEQTINSIDQERLERERERGYVP